MYYRYSLILKCIINIGIGVISNDRLIMSDCNILAVLISMVLSGCGLLTSDSDGRIIAQIDSANESYSLDKETVIDLRKKNVSSKTIFYSTCDSGSIHELKDSEIKNSSEYTNPCYCVCIFPIEPDEMKELSVQGHLIRDKNELEFTSEVRYRVLPHFYKDRKSVV